MTAEIINLRKARKARQRAEKDAAAEANRARHGRTAAERKLAEAERKIEQRRADAHRLDEDDPGDGSGPA
jgi:uncharacterized membrane protein YccC